MIHKSCSIPFGKQKIVVRSWTKWKNFIGRRGGGVGFSGLDNLPVGDKGVCVTDYLIIIYQKLPD